MNHSKREGKIPSLVLLALMGALLGSASPRPRIYVFRGESYHVFHVAYPPTWSLEEHPEGIVLSAPDRAVSVHVSTRASRGESTDDCAAALLRDQHVALGTTPTRTSFINMNWRAVTLEARDRRDGDPEDTIHLSACLTTTTELPYPIVSFSTAARASAFDAHRDVIYAILESVRFRPAA